MRSSELTRARAAARRVLGRPPARASSTPFSRRFDLAAHGLTWRWARGRVRAPARGRRAAPPPGARSRRPPSELGGRDGRRWRSLFGPLAERLRRPRRGDRPADAARPGATRSRWRASGCGRACRRRCSPAAGGRPRRRALFAGVAAHAFRRSRSPMSSAIGVTLGTAAHRFGWPVAEGGSQAIGRAMVAAAEERGARFETGVEVTSLDELDDADVVMLDVAPAAAARIAGERMPRRVARALPALPPRPRGLQGRLRRRRRRPLDARAVAAGRAPSTSAARSRRSPAPSARSRAGGCPSGRSSSSASRAWPTRHAPADGVHPALRLRARPRRLDTATRPRRSRRRSSASRPAFATGSSAGTSARPARWRQYNPNYVGGDIVTGANDPLQMVFRPRMTMSPYATGIDGVFLCSAATPPGAGAHGMCGLQRGAAPR